MTRLPGILLCILPMLALADNGGIGRLFLSPAERASLDAIRQNSKPPEKIVNADETHDGEKDIAPDAPAPATPVVTVRGYVKRSDGKGTVWVNGLPLSEKTTAKDFEVGRLRGDTDQVQIRLSRTGQTVSIKAGQSFDPASGKVVQNLQDLPRSPSAGSSGVQKPTGAAKMPEKSPPDPAADMPKRP
ncbi:MAG TPA: hypothetical protein VGK14_02875 [Novimethylophilus sp.]|jgi:hypothetical protein|uniref:hypothetical protein n=1 Tax=Novimethylophilus sp. TaxID=2137426 RepID=UPI002F3E23A8